jgi:site-specific recombinase XerD
LSTELDDLDWSNMDTMTDLADDWLLTLGTVSEATRTVYGRSVRQLIAWLAAEHPDVREPEQVVLRHLDAWIAHLTDAGRSEGTRRVRLIAARLFFANLVDEPDIPATANPAERIALPTRGSTWSPSSRTPTCAPYWPSAPGASFVDLRDVALLRVLIDTGCRRGQVSGIDVADVDLRTQDVTLRRTKGGHERVVPVGAKTAVALRKYLRARARRPAAGSAALFLSIRPDDYGSWRISGEGVARMLARRCVLAGLPALHPHQLRHTWAHDQLAHGAQESDVERLAGWRSPTMVRRYGASAAAECARDSARRLPAGTGYDRGVDRAEAVGYGGRPAARRRAAPVQVQAHPARRRAVPGPVRPRPGPDVARGGRPARRGQRVAAQHPVGDHEVGRDDQR